jgi:hypothetical protein
LVVGGVCPLVPHLARRNTIGRRDAPLRGPFKLAATFRCRCFVLLLHTLAFRYVICTLGCCWPSVIKLVYSGLYRCYIVFGCSCVNGLL